MSNALDVLRSFAAWWQEGLAKVGEHMSQVYEAPVQSASTEDESNADREAWEEERARLALSPWWM